MKSIAIQDANILIDLIKIGLFDQCLALPYRFTTTNIILHTELNDNQVTIIQPHIHSAKFTIIEITPEELEEIQIASLEDHRLSEQDWSAFYYAQKMEALLMTGDRRLRILAESKSVEVCGILWIFDELVSRQILTPAEACDFLSDLMQKNRRLPLEECDNRLTAWKSN